MANKMSVIETFMTLTDEDNFSRLLRKELPEVGFIDIFNWSAADPVFRDSLANCNGFSKSLELPISKQASYAAILHTGIVSIEEYKEVLVSPHPTGIGYEGVIIGSGLIQFIGAAEADFAENCLQNGRLAASYDSDFDKKTAEFVKVVWKVFKKNAVRLYWVNQETGELNEKPESRFFAWPDAAEKYDGSHGNYLANHAFAYFVAKKK